MTRSLIQTQAEILAQKLREKLPTPPSLPSADVRPENPLLKQSLASLIDHTLLRSEATSEQIRAACDEAKVHGFGAVCVNTGHLELAAQLLRSTAIHPIAVVGFPLGTMHSRAKASETRIALELGAREIDMVIRVDALISGDFATALDDILAVTEAAQSVPVKVILETCLLTPEQIIQGSLISVWGGAKFVKTSTGFSKSGATTEVVALMRKTVGPEIGVKASGGIRTHEDAMAMIQAGANRLGTSNGVAIVSGLQKVAATQGAY